jgi:hypothetical protein
MPRVQRLFVSACAFVTAFALGYVGVDYGKVPHPTYDPLAHGWRLAGRTSGVPMGYYGLWLYALIAALIVGGAVWLWTGRRSAPARDGTLALLAAWAGTAWAIAAGYFAWMNWP